MLRGGASCTNAVSVVTSMLHIAGLRGCGPRLAAAPARSCQVRIRVRLFVGEGMGQGADGTFQVGQVFVDGGLPAALSPRPLQF
jgi:hypothetical protein